MEITFIKYKPNSSGILYNYFDTENWNSIEDRLVLNKLPKDTFTILNDEAEDVNDFFQVKPSDFDLTVSFLETKKSSNNKSVKQFFSDFKDRKILVLFIYGGINISGFIDTTTIEKDKTYTQNKNEISFTVVGILKEFSDYYKGLYINKVTGNEDISFDNYFNEGWHFNSLHSSGTGKAIINNQLFLQRRTGFNPKVYKKLQNSIWDNNGDIDRINQWKTFQEIAEQFGFIYRLILVPASKTSNYPQFELKMFWRSSENLATIEKVIEDKEGFSLPQINKFVSIRPYEWIFYQQQGQETREFTVSEGIVFNNTDVWTIDRYNNPTKVLGLFRKFISISPTQILPTKNITIERFVGQTLEWQENISNYSETLDIPTDETRYSTTLINNFLPAGVSMYSRIFHEDFTEHYNGTNISIDWGSPQIYLATFFLEYQILLSGFRETRKYKIKYDENSNIKLFSKIPLGDKIFWVNRITNLNLIEKSAEIELIQF